MILLWYDLIIYNLKYHNMYNLNFDELLNNSNLDKDSVKKMKWFFNKDYVLEALIDLTSKRKPNLIKLFLILFFIFIGVMYLIYYSNLVKSIAIPVQWAILFLTSVWILVNFFKTLKKEGNKLSNDLNTNFLKNIDKNIHYSENNDYFNFDLSNINKNNFLKPFTKVYEPTHSISYSSDNFNVNWGLITTSMKMRTQQWIRVEENTNYWYLYKIEFKNITKEIKSTFSLTSTTHEDTIWKYVWATAYAFLFYIFLIFIFIFGSNSEITTLKFISYSLIYYIIFCYIYISFRYSDSWVYLDYKFKNKLNIFTDNIQNTESTLDNVFVSNINLFFDSIWNNKKYNFCFIKNELYIYQDLKTLDWSGFLEFSLFKSLNGNINNFLDFYIWFHSIVKLSEKLNKEFYNKTV